MSTRIVQPGAGAQALGLALIAGYAALVGTATGPEAYHRWGGLIVVPVLLMLTVHLILRIGHRAQDAALVRILLLALAAKCVGTAARYWMTFVLYDGSADAAVYHWQGQRLAAAYSQGDFTSALPTHDIIGTGFIQVLTGALYTVTGPSRHVAYAFFALLSFWGLYFFYRAFCIGIPSGDSRRYALLVLFLPSMVFWPSSLGKEAWMTFAIGLSALGASRLLATRPGWLLPLVAGLTATAMVRPPITAALFAALSAAIMIRRPVAGRTPLTPVIKAVVLAGLMVVGVFVMNRAADFLEVDSLTSTSVSTATARTEDQTTQGGSAFEAQPVTSVLDMPHAAVTVLFRPFVFEVTSLQAMLAAAEGGLLLALFALSWRRFLGILTRLRTEPYLLLCAVYTLLFVYGYSNIGNFGILTRQRVQVLPFVVVFLALPLVRRGGAHSASHRNPTAEVRP